jgi:hypothetical protein
LNTLAYSLNTVAYILNTLAYIVNTLAYILHTLAYMFHSAAYSLSTVGYNLNTLAYSLNTLAYSLNTLAYIGSYFCLGPVHTTLLGALFRVRPNTFIYLLLLLSGSRFSNGAYILNVVLNRCLFFEYSCQ